MELCTCPIRVPYLLRVRTITPSPSCSDLVWTVKVIPETFLKCVTDSHRIEGRNRLLLPRFGERRACYPSNSDSTLKRGVICDPKRPTILLPSYRQRSSRHPSPRARLCRRKMSARTPTPPRSLRLRTLDLHRRKSAIRVRRRRRLRPLCSQKDRGPIHALAL